MFMSHDHLTTITNRANWSYGVILIVNRSNSRPLFRVFLQFFLSFILKNDYKLSILLKLKKSIL